MSLHYLDDPAPPAAGPQRFEAVVGEADRRRRRRQSLAFSALGAALVLAVAVAGLWPRARSVDVATGSGPPTTIAPTPTTTLAAPHSVPGPPIAVTPLPATAQPATAMAGSSSTNSGPTPPSDAPACAPTQLSLTTTVPAASANQGAIVRLTLTNVSGSPCTVVSEPCTDSGFTIETPNGAGVSRNATRTCAFPPSSRRLGPGDVWTTDDVWSALAPATPGGYVARGFWRVNGSGPLVGTAAPFELR